MAFDVDVIIIGAGAAGLMCAAQAGQRGRRVWLADHAKKLGEKIRISGGGRCNFTNLEVQAGRFLSQNPHFCISALKQYTQHDFISLVNSYKIAWHEKKLGQLFCDRSSQQIIDMLVAECAKGSVTPQMGVEIQDVKLLSSGGYSVQTNRGTKTAQSLVIASGGLSIPKIGASRFAFDVAKQFDLKIVPPRPALVPLVFQNDLLERCRDLSGLSVEANVMCGKQAFSEGLLFTHRGLSGPSILQISSYWQEGQAIQINLTPQTDIYFFLKDRKQNSSRTDIHNAMAEILPKRLAVSICQEHAIAGRLAEINDKNLLKIAKAINEWSVIPTGTEGYRTAEVTLGGIDTNEISSQTMEAKRHKGLYFIGEALDVTGWLGGYNFQWAWSSGFVAGQNA